MIFLFLDFDGTLHGDSPESSLFEHMHSFCNTLNPYLNNIKIVISSSWRETHSFSDLVHFFPKHIQPNIVGITPILPNNLEPGIREQEILTYCITHDISKEKWIAIDDMPQLFSQESQDQSLIGNGNILFTESSTDLTDFDLKMLSFMIQKIL